MSSLLEQVGRVIGGRYRLLAVIGAGASAQVFAADDTRLARRVAVKLLHPALAGDATFLRKFQAEARLAASLNHRNVLHVYDWGAEDGMPYLVLEYLGGGSLRSMLDAGRLLSPQQAATVGAQAAHGLAYAHRRGLVHRDIKPANLLFDEDGRLLVSDFGLARALAEAAITEPLGAVMGTARYASPEQVEGRPVDDRTDVYSLALTLYESVTGRVPFAGETTVATMMARVGAVLPPARELGPLAPVLAQAAISEPLARLDAPALASELEMLLQELDPPEPLPLSRIDLGLARLPEGRDRDPTERLALAVPPPVASAPPAPAAAPPAPAAAPPAAPPAPAAAPPAPAAAPAPPTPPPAAALAGVRRITPAQEAAPAGTSGKTGRRGRWLRWLLVVLLIEVIAGAGFVAASRVVLNHHTVPRVVGLALTNADSAIRGDGLNPEIIRFVYSGHVAAGRVISQSPPSGKREKTGAIVKLVVSQGRHPTTVPALTEMTQVQAAAALQSAHLVPSFSRASNETIASGIVVNSTPVAGDKVVYGDHVNVVISTGPPPQIIPADLSGGVVTWTQAQATLEGLHLKAVERPVYSTTISAGWVVTTEPPPGTTVRGHSTVRVLVSLGPPFVKIPLLYSDSVGVAEQDLRSIGLKWQLIGLAGANFVLTQLPAAGSFVRVGTTIDLYLF